MDLTDDMKQQEISSAFKPFCFLKQRMEISSALKTFMLSKATDMHIPFQYMATISNMVMTKSRKQVIQKLGMVKNRVKA